MYNQDKYICPDQDVLKTFCDEEDEKRLEDVFSKMNACWKGADLYKNHLVKNKIGQKTLNRFQWKVQISCCKLNVQKPNQSWKQRHKTVIFRKFFINFLMKENNIFLKTAFLHSDWNFSFSVQDKKMNWIGF